MDQFGSVVLVRKTMADFAKCLGVDENIAIGLAYMHTKRLQAAVEKELRNAKTSSEPESVPPKLSAGKSS